jgi:electron transfer flavoprotein beta subunit
MKILVTVKETTTVSDTFRVDGTTIDEQYTDHELNEWDDYAVAAAGDLAEDHDDVEVVAVTIGSERTEETIREALAKGVDRAIRVWDDALADRQLLDVATKANILAAVVEREDPDLVLTGTMAGDDAFGATGVALADELDFGWAAVVTDIDVDEAADSVAVHRELEGGVEERTDVDLPAVLTIQTGITEPAYASLRGIRQAQRKELATCTLSELDVDASTLDSQYDLTDMYQPESEGSATLLEGEPEEQAGHLASLFDELGVTAQ